MQIGFTTLREIVIQRPSLREEALRVLLELTTHPGLQIFLGCHSYYDTHFALPPESIEKVTRGAAIITVKRWVPDTQPMDSFVRGFALQMLHKLQFAVPPKKEKESQNADVPMIDSVSTATSSEADVAATPATVPAKSEDREVKAEEDGDENMEDGQLPSDELIQTPYLPERIELPAQKSLVLQHVELLFALSVKAPEFLDE
jgi:symplekin